MSDQKVDVNSVEVVKDLVQKLEQAEKALAESEERQRLLLNSIKDYAIFTLDINGFITSWNSGAKSIKGYTSDEVLNQHFSIFYPQDARESGLPEKVLAIAQSTGHYEDEGWRIRKDGNRASGQALSSRLSLMIAVYCAAILRLCATFPTQADHRSVAARAKHASGRSLKALRLELS
jgi:PAS domain S-box-containing protein